ncbi:hypothetical protein JL721_284 [Aureococcus anophagefferens]|nr:hypothetical protein JL721_284 [Aureococcus anophagefferens]
MARRPAALLALCAATAGGFLRPAPQPLHATVRAAESPLASSSSTLEARWVAPECWVGDEADLGDAEAAALLPLYVLDAPLVPGSTHEMTVRHDDAGLLAMVDDLLARGGRRMVTTMGVREQDDGSAALAQMGCVMTLESVKEGNGDVKWRVTHGLSRDRVRIDKVIARGEGDESYLRCVATDVPDEPLEVSAGATVRVTDGKRLGAEGVVEAVVNGWVRLRTADGAVVSSRGRSSVEVLKPPPAAGDLEPDARDGPARALIDGVLAKLEKTGQDLETLVRSLGGPGPEEGTTRPLLETAFGDAPACEREVLDLLRDIAALQKTCDEDVRFNEAAVGLLGASRGVGVGTLWHLADSCWLAYLDQRAASRKKRLHADLHERLLEFLRDSGRLPGDDDLFITAPEATTLALSELPPDLRNMLTSLDDRVRDDLEPMGSAKCELQALLDVDDHEGRCGAFSDLLRGEKARLVAAASLRKLFEPAEALPYGPTIQLPTDWDAVLGDDDDPLSA